MHDWGTDVRSNPKGFARVISHTKHTLVLNDHWSNPRPPTRVWCLFEGYQTLDRGGVLEMVLGEKQRLDLQLSLDDRFGEVEASDAAAWARETASYEVETHGARKLFSLLEHEFARSGSCVPQAQHEVLRRSSSAEHAGRSSVVVQARTAPPEQG